MFSGEYDYKVDDKGRVPLPPKFRQELKGEVVLQRGVEKCIAAYSVTEFRKLADKLGEQSIPGAKLRKLKRALLGSAFPVEIDGQGRVSLPYPLRSHAGINDAAVVIGVGNSFEFWNPDLWGSEKTTDAEEAWQIIESFQEQGQQ